jgi:hypothetical protein
MAGKRLVPKSLVESNEDKLRAAVAAAWADQLVKLTTTLRSHGITLSLTAAGKPAVAALGSKAIPNLWSQSAWLKNLDTHLAPVANEVADASLNAATTTLGLASLWGQADTTDDAAQAIVDRAISYGQWIGDRLDAAAVKGPAPTAVTAAGKPKTTGPPIKAPSPTVEELGTEPVGDVVEVDLASILAIAPDALGDVIASMANTAATLASQDVTNYLAAYVTSAEADPYLSATKTWNNTGDDRVRETHQDVEDVPINELFDVGGGMVGPGDPAGDDSETINCRCWVTYDGVVPEGSGYEAGQAPQYQGEASQGAPDEPDMEGEDA